MESIACMAQASDFPAFASNFDHVTRKSTIFIGHGAGSHPDDPQIIIIGCGFVNWTSIDPKKLSSSADSDLFLTLY
jgi:hypothetical protein